MRAVTDDSFQIDVIEASQKRPIMIDFWGPRCGPCLQMMPFVEQLAEQVAGRADLVKVNTAENKRLAVKLRVMGLPTFAVYQAGLEVERLTGDACTPASIAAVVEKYTTAPV